MANERQMIEEVALRIVQTLSPSTIYMGGKAPVLNRKATELKWEIEKAIRQAKRDGYEEACVHYKDAIDAYEESR